jgi:hypothetical protein
MKEILNFFVWVSLGIFVAVTLIKGAMVLKEPKRFLE